MGGGSKQVWARAGPLECASTHRLCAERLLVWHWKRRARRKGVRGDKLVHWLRRKMGGIIVVRRPLAHAGRLGCSVPCLLCRDVLRALDLTVVCTALNHSTYVGKLDGPGAPPSRLTSGQQRAAAVRNQVIVAAP